jgi:hypothetical protein
VVDVKNPGPAKLSRLSAASRPVLLTALNPVIEDAVDAGIVTVISDEPVTTKAPCVILPTLFRIPG